LLFRVALATFGIACSREPVIQVAATTGSNLMALGQSLPDLAFQTERDGVAQAIRLSDLQAGPVDSAGAALDAKPALLLLRVSARWCRTCVAQAAYTATLLSEPNAANVKVLDLLFAGEDNQPAGLVDLSAWRALLPAQVDVALDPELRLEPLFAQGHRPLPWIVLVDAVNRQVVDTMVNPDAASLTRGLASALARVAGHAHASAAQPLEAPVRIDDRFDEMAWSLWRGTRERFSNSFVRSDLFFALRQSARASLKTLPSPRASGIRQKSCPRYDSTCLLAAPAPVPSFPWLRRGDGRATAR
jgi:hypothetical protein